MDVVDYDTATVFQTERMVELAMNRFAEDYELESYEIVAIEVC